MDLEKTQHQKAGKTRSRTWRLSFAATLFGAVLILAGCGSSSSGGSSSGGGSGSTSSQKAPKIAYLTYASTAYVTAEEEGLHKVLDPIGGSFTMFNANYDPQKQLTQCTDAITSQRYNALVIAAVQGSAIIPCVTQAKAAGLPVVAIEIPIGPDQNKIPPQVPGVVGSVVYTGLEHAKLLVPFVDQACAGLTPCDVIVEVDSLADPYAAQWLKYLKTNKGSNVTIVKVMEGQYDNTVTAKNVPDALLANPNTDVMVLESDDNAVAAIPAVKKQGLQDQIKLIGDGGSEIGVNAIKAGTLYGTFANWPNQMGQAVGKMTIDAVNGTTIASPAVNALTMDTPQLVTKANVDQFTPEWK